ncbi:hypothetical protein RCL1_004047 [Eukaryota sp. TZLM3-RCL]
MEDENNLIYSFEVMHFGTSSASTTSTTIPVKKRTNPLNSDSSFSLNSSKSFSTSGLVKPLPKSPFCKRSNPIPRSTSSSHPPLTTEQQEPPAPTTIPLTESLAEYFPKEETRRRCFQTILSADQSNIALPIDLFNSTNHPIKADGENKFPDPDIVPDLNNSQKLSTKRSSSRPLSTVSSSFPPIIDRMHIHSRAISELNESSSLNNSIIFDGNESRSSTSCSLRKFYGKIPDNFEEVEKARQRRVSISRNNHFYVGKRALSNPTFEEISKNIPDPQLSKTFRSKASRNQLTFSKIEPEFLRCCKCPPVIYPTHEKKLFVEPKVKSKQFDEEKKFAHPKKAVNEVEVKGIELQKEAEQSILQSKLEEQKRLEKFYSESREDLITSLRSKSALSFTRSLAIGEPFVLKQFQDATSPPIIPKKIRVGVENEIKDVYALDSFVI